MAFANTSITDIVATTLEYRSPIIADNVSNSNAFWFLLKDKGGVQLIDGGRTIYEPISFAENGNFGFYSGYETLQVSPSDMISGAEYAWKQAACPVTFSGLEMLQNSGEAADKDLVKARVKVTEATFINGMQTASLSDGTAYGGRTMGGLAALVSATPTTGTVGGINRATATNVFWRNQAATATITAANVQAKFGALWLLCKRGKDETQMILAGSTTWGFFMESVEVLARFTNPKLAEAGFQSIKFMGADVVPETSITATNSYFLNLDYLGLKTHKKRNMVPLDPASRWSVNQDAVVKIIGWAGNMTMSNGARQGIQIGA